MLQRALVVLDRGIADGGFAENARERTRKDVWIGETMKDGSSNG